MRTRHGGQRTGAADPSDGVASAVGLILVASASLLLAACATQSATGIAPAAPGFLLGLWHGFIFPIAWLLSLFMPEVAVYSVPNNGGWYDFGYFLGIAVFGVGARKSQIVYRDRVVVREERA